MHSIGFYISGHGFGHATRMIAIIRSLFELREDLRVHVRTSVPPWLFHKSLPNKQVHVVPTEENLRVSYTRGLSVDSENTLFALEKYVKDKRNYLAEHLAYCKKHNIEIIISDIPPFILEVAAKQQCPSIAISNFTWYDIYEPLCNKAESHFKALKALWSAYQKADLAMVLPFNVEMQMFKHKINVPLVARIPTRTKEEVRKSLGVSQQKPLVFLSLGLHRLSDASALCKVIEVLRKLNCTILMSSNLTGKVQQEKAVHYIPSKDPNSQDYVRACDLVIAKTGYGIVSECVAYGIPMIFTTRTGFCEDEVTKEFLLKRGYSKYISVDKLFSGEIGDSVKTLLAESGEAKERRVPPTGNLVVAEKILEFL